MNDNKLYTEEQLRNSMLSMKTYIQKYNESVIDSIIEKHIKALGVVKLPSDEEIDDEMHSTDKYHIMKDFYCDGFKDGAKWMLNKIQGGNK